MRFENPFPPQPEDPAQLPTVDSLTSVVILFFRFFFVPTLSPGVVIYLTGSRSRSPNHDLFFPRNAIFFILAFYHNFQLLLSSELRIFFIKHEMKIFASVTPAMSRTSCAPQWRETVRTRQHCVFSPSPNSHDQISDVIVRAFPSSLIRIAGETTKTKRTKYKICPFDH